MNTLKQLALVSLPLLALGCAADSDTDSGTPLASVTGQVTTSLSSPPTALEAVVVWNNSAASPDTVTGQAVPVTGDFPASFTLDFFTPPAESALNDYTNNGANPNESHIGIGYIAALPPGADLSGDGPVGPIGLSEDYMLAYVQEDIQPGSQSEALLGEALPAGFYIMEVIDVDDPACPGDIFDCLRRAPDGMDTPVNLIITDEEIDAPNWT